MYYVCNVNNFGILTAKVKKLSFRGKHRLSVAYIHFKLRKLRAFLENNVKINLLVSLEKITELHSFGYFAMIITS